MEILLVTFGALLLAVCFFEWRTVGLLIVFVIGFAQDPIRKLAPDEPVYYVVLFVPFLVGVILGYVNHGHRISLAQFYMSHPATRFPVSLFVGIVMVGIIAAFLKTGSIIISGIGGVAYLTPFVAMLFFYHYSRGESDVVRLFHLYIVAAAVMTVGVYLSYWEIDWDVLRSVGGDLYVYPTEVGIYKLPAGLFRSPEVAAWHISTAMCILVVLVVSKRWRLGLLLALLFGLFFLGAAFLAGRRKMIIEILIFLSVYGGLLVYFRSGATKLFAFLMSGGLLLFVIDSLILPEVTTSVFLPIIDRGSSLVEQAWNRFSLMTVDSFKWVIDRHGYFGTGAGTASQGAQYFGGGSRLVGGTGEGGVAKIFTELGVIGVLVFLWMIVALALSMWHSVSDIARKEGGSSLLSMNLGLCAFMVANFAVYVTAAQVFGDPFVLFTLGILGGSILCIPPPVAYRTNAPSCAGPYMTTPS